VSQILNIPQLSPDASLEELRDYVAVLKKTLDYYLNGNITSANASEIGGFLIQDTRIVSAKGNVGMSSNETGANDVRFWAGDTTPTAAPFRVYEDGTIFAKNITDYIDDKVETGIDQAVEDSKGYVDETSAATLEEAKAIADAAAIAAMDAAILKGENYNSVIIDDSGFKVGGSAGSVVTMGEFATSKYGVVAYHIDGSTTILSSDGLLRQKGGSTKAYSYLSATGSAETGSTGNKFDGGVGRYASGLANGAGIPNVTIQLPDDFKGKDFGVAVSLKSASSYVMARADGDDYWVSDMEGGTYLEVVAIDKPNARFTVKGYGLYWVINGQLYDKFYAIAFSWVAVA
jgi:hypothetical protein